MRGVVIHYLVKYFMKYLFPVTVLVLALQLAPGTAFGSEPLSFPLRGRTLTLTVYRPAGGKPKGTVLIGSGDVGWVGLAAEMAEFLAGQGYTAVGINVRQYLAEFTSGKTTLTTREPPVDYAQIASFLRQRNLLAASSQKNHDWINGVLTMGLPPTAELGWRWTDFTSWITKKDADEPMFAPREFLAQVSPIPLCLIHSTRDEYVTEADYRLFERVARQPKRFVLINASNHRFTDRKDELKREVMNCVAWIRSQPGSGSS
jgi:dienelactone hydrolase